MARKLVRLTEDQEENIRRLAREGEPLYRIAGQHGVGLKRVKEITAKEGKDGNDRQDRG